MFTKWNIWCSYLRRFQVMVSIELHVQLHLSTIRLQNIIIIIISSLSVQKFGNNKRWRKNLFAITIKRFIRGKAWCGGRCWDVGTETDRRVETDNVIAVFSFLLLLLSLSLSLSLCLSLPLSPFFLLFTDYLS